MKVLYTAPNRSHHYKYAAALNAAGYLYAFVSGFPRISPRAHDTNLHGKIYRSDILQTLYIASLKCRLPVKLCSWLAFLSKIEQDLFCLRFVEKCDIFLYYNGSGLTSSRCARKTGVINIVEVVNSHVEYQENILKEEHARLNLPWTPFPEKEKRRRLKEYDEADYILLPSEFVRRSFIEKGFDEDKLLKVPYGFNKMSGTGLRTNDYGSNFTILYVGSISVRKGLKYLIEAFHRLHCQRKQLIIVGPDTKDGALKESVLTNNILFTGVLKDRQLEDAYRSADVFCLPSVEEGMALVLGEALSFGLPIITTVNTGAEEIITDGKEGFIVPVQDSAGICQKMQLFADDADMLKLFRNAAMEKSSKLEGWDESGIRLTNTMENVLINRHGN